MIEMLEPWHLVTEEERSRLEVELNRELSFEHVLTGKTLRALARRQDCDDVLFEVDGVGLAVVHLTWSRETRPDWPNTEIYGSITDWIERRMKPDHEAFF
jgi:hypothetical protein